ncbi:sulfotransferase [Shewanella ulleungensis]|uniref:Sulfotransferase family protein n=1 Tax=Shewanella ulleungensis TaxID=2282699 RepID=A0ABQ2QM81_9GAMM|nr:sulfotransferase [Shewanella ulleungensis]MCL1149838.1 sulfotransferase [Shewanella ulleungensis]GGP84945.1 sulfotransferase family protein [Shewanella ulleungensis]
MDNIDFNQPVAIGGVGGSGTRLVAEIVKQLGYFIGDDLNQANDNLLFTLLFKDARLWGCDQNDFNARCKIFEQVSLKVKPLEDEQITQVAHWISHRSHPSKAWLSERLNQAVISSKASKIKLNWAWKEPNTHIFLPYILNYYPNVKYIHVMRNGLDMAYSKNQNQLNLWGIKLLQYVPSMTPADSLNYWIEVHKRIKAFEKYHPKRILLVNYDKLNNGTLDELNKIINFLKIEVDKKKTDKLKLLFKAQSSSQRYKEYKNDFVTNQQIDFLTKLGFEINL